MRFDEVELETAPVIEEHAPVAASADGASRARRLAALLIDISLFAALSLVLLPLLPERSEWVHAAALTGFIVMLTYYYFVGCWMLGGKTIGGAIFDVRVIPDQSHAMTLRGASVRWVAVYLSLATLGIGFALAALPSRRSLPDRMSSTRCV